MFRTIIAVLSLVLALAAFLLYTKPAHERAQALRLELGQYDAALNKADELQRLKQMLLSRYNALDPLDINRLHRLLPDHVDNVRLVLDLDTLAAQYGLAIQNVVISEPTSRSADRATIGTAQAKQAFDSLTMRFSTRGTYQNFVRFIEDVETSLRIVDLTALTISRESTEPGAEPMYRYDITLRTYWLK
ncbi:hypothetical protein COU20_00320 [Candidatus Kaiserbacteria bacterium CG10_big_fil_rev_8_21_14_0_10_59_10]|uniref:Type 4a pilus biogenesis protein PilO n=1 Tax=Candidatus Kaiserbacteria bacterium CG10_big_fil_rev_8_21_14_0_10_59_10 TaxID=1974612 RepID=A0A2H0U8L7_9BACT|nr:MAG: hypothetical protein COU20_00320 [Candidatus Kaiserbacteria bacterium CG10_big_fil_rev_8_21_14_0_10_59_10]